MLSLRLQSLSEAQDIGSVRGTAYLVDIGQGLLDESVLPETIVTICPHPRQAVHACAPYGDLQSLTRACGAMLTLGITGHGMILV